MMQYHRIIIVLWSVVIAYWVVSAMQAKRRLRGNTWIRGWWVRLVLVAGVIELHRFRVFRELSYNLYATIAARYPVIGEVGVLLCAAGIAFAIWARHTIGRNWGMPMSLQEDHALVTTGPYAWVRHPIYTGILFALLGTALVEGMAAFLIFIISSVYFIYSAITEEKLMLAQFPQEYPAYMKRTKRLIPFVW
jgi:protein-S-isoprenylcysteine O-methyltransferase Ste14